MQKYICIPCGYIYDPELGDPDGGVAPAHRLKIYLKTGYALFAMWAKKTLSLLRDNP